MAPGTDVAIDVRVEDSLWLFVTSWSIFQSVLSLSAVHEPVRQVMQGASAAMITSWGCATVQHSSCDWQGMLQILEMVLQRFGDNDYISAVCGASMALN